ncbi:MAG: hypothetical protein UT84_C0002G0084 [Candidatus Curtissbacteria bacterium GW2011_GWA1_40_16]|uniref:Uncharacterized protein n=1 Tax=Candidatus Curtissbacteria bacterium GW2011_GWA1_40_16 TaxID=1618405 RepID=A0A0G0RFK9_9BACT|nr:MAG: hypothetical protein UT84_C0002G0084 [Candidatus Curtissbacteria bacterium GW2011_GWA1_40_16]
MNRSKLLIKKATFKKYFFLIILFALPIATFFIGLNIRKTPPQSDTATLQTYASPSATPNCGNLPQTVKTAITPEKDIFIDGPHWSYDCRYAAWAKNPLSYDIRDLLPKVFLYRTQNDRIEEIKSPIAGNHPISNPKWTEIGYLRVDTTMPNISGNVRIYYQPGGGFSSEPGSGTPQPLQLFNP